MKLDIDATDLKAAQARGLVADADALWRFLSLRAGSAAATSPRFTFTHLLYYLGGMVAIGAATLFMTQAFAQLGAAALLGTGLVYAAACIAASRVLARRGLEVPAGILATLAVCLVPMVTWAAQSLLGLWPDGAGSTVRDYHRWIDWRWLTLEWATLTAAAVALWALRYPFLMLPVAFTLWYLGMDLARFIVPPSDPDAWDFHRDFTMFFGLVMLLLAFWIDQRSRSRDPERPGSGRDYAFWLYLLGMLSFWGALSARPSDYEWSKALYALLNLGFIGLGVLLDRRVFTVCGAFGVAGYLAHLSHVVFKDSLLFPLALSAIGLLLIAAGLVWQRHETRWRRRLWQRLPPALRGWMVQPLNEGP
jgi:hypothetical protein